MASVLSTTTGPAANNIIFTENEMHARNYPVLNGHSVQFNDKNSGYLYIKSVDQSGIMTTFLKSKTPVEFEEAGLENMVPKSDFEALQKKVEELSARLEEKSEPAVAVKPAEAPVVSKSVRR